MSYSSVLGQMRTAEWVTLAATVALTIWAWSAFVIGRPQEIGTAALVMAVVNIAGGTLQVIFLLYVRPSGTLRQRLSFGGFGGPLSGSWILFVAPAVLVGLVLLVITPPDTPVVDFDPDMNVYQTIGMFALLTLVFTVIGAGVVSLLVVVPVAMLIAAALPRGRSETEQSGSTGLTRLQLVLGALLMFSAVGFALSMTAIGESSVSTQRGRMLEQFLAFVTGAGNPIATASALFFLVAIVVICVINNRSEARRRRRAGRV